VGLVVEYKREIGELDAFQWYCDECNHLLHEVEVQLEDIVKQLPPLFDAFWENKDGRTCSQCSAYLEKP
jgi:3-hydroxyanthranilate 3,4-dioxygenase